MAKVKQLFEDNLQALMEAYMADHPEADPADALDAALILVGNQEEREATAPKG